MTAMHRNPEAQHPATARRRQQAMREGHVIRSRDLIWVAIWLAVIIGLSEWGTRVLAGWSSLATHTWSVDATKTAPEQLLRTSWMQSGRLVLPLLGLIALFAILANLVAGGWRFHASKLVPTLSRLRMQRARLSPDYLIQSLSTALKTASLIGTTGVFVWFRRFQILQLGRDPLPQTWGQTLQLLTTFGLYIAVTLAVWAALDLLLSRWKLALDLRMTDQELRDEQQDIDGDPQVHAVRDVIQRERARGQLAALPPGTDLLLVDGHATAVGLRLDSHGLPTQITQSFSGIPAVQAIHSAQVGGLPVLKDPQAVKVITARRVSENSNRQWQNQPTQRGEEPTAGRHVPQEIAFRLQAELGTDRS